MLIPLFDPEHFQFYVHVDQKASISEFEFLRAYSNVTTIRDRLNIFWGGFNMVRAEIALLSAAISNQQCQAFMLISDDSFPLRSGEHIRAAVLAEENWIDQHELNDGYFLDRYRNYHYFDSMATDPQFRPPETRTIGMDEIQDMKDLEALLRVGKKPVKLYQGAQWWCLSKTASLYLLRMVDEDSHLKESFRFSAVPDELYFQTVIGNSGENWPIRPTQMYFDFSQNPKPFVYSNMEQLATPFSSDRLFVRKVLGDKAFLQAIIERIPK
jgi:hypothetical protein